MSSVPHTPAVMVGHRLATTPYDEARFRLAELETPMGWRLGDVIARLVLDSGAVAPTSDLAEAWDEGYAVADDDFTHSDYRGTRCQCAGIHGTRNPYRREGRP